MEQYVISVDLGSSKVVAALGKRSFSDETIVVDIVEKPMEGYTRGEITNILQVTNAIKEAVAELATRHSLDIKKVWVSVAGKHVVCTNNSGSVYVGGAGGEVTQQDVDKLRDNMHNVQAPEGKIILDHIPQSYKVDAEETISSPVGRFGHQLSTTVTFVLGGKSVLERITNAFGRINIQKVEYISSAMASGSVVASEEEKDAGVVVIDLGAGTTDLCVIQNKVIRYVASIPIGANTINADIRTMAIPQSKIEKLKIKCGYATASVIPADKLNNSIRINTQTTHQKSKEITYRDLTTIIEARMLDIVEFVIEAIKASGYSDKIGSGIILTGGGAKLAGVDTLFRERTGRDVRISGADQNIAFNSNENYNKPEYATVVGLLDLAISKSDIEPYDDDIVEETEEEVITPGTTETLTGPTENDTPATPKEMSQENQETQENQEETQETQETQENENQNEPKENEEENKANKKDTDEGGFFSSFRNGTKKTFKKIVDKILGEVVDDNV